MKSLQQLCEPRSSVFDSQRRDTVLDLTDLINDRVKPEEFFDENFITDGMKVLLEQGFRRLEGKSSQGVFKLKQAMGGGKTHNLLALGLLARHPEFRARVMSDIYKSDPNLGPVKVVAFSGRESDAPYGLWGSIAEQMGKRDLFKDLYSPLQAPGQKAWENLLAGETVLILLDELPPYLENARARTIGNSDLAQVTVTALSNLLIAIGREGCEHVCLVITDLAGVYERGSAVLSDLEKETHRTAMTLEPVRTNSDELYHILRTRLFEKPPRDGEINEIAQGYAGAIRDAGQMVITNESPERIRAALDRLMKLSLVVFRRFNRTWMVWQGSDVDLEERLQQAWQQLSGVFSLASAVQDYLPPRPIVAHHHSYQTGTTRYFGAVYVNLWTLGGVELINCQLYHQ
jgi:hypothetical protein